MPQLDPTLIAEAEAALQLHGDKAAAARALGISRETLRDRLLSRQRAAQRAAMRGEVGGPPIPDAARPPEGFVIARNSGTYAPDGSLLRQSIQTRPDSGEMFEVPEGHAVRRESTLVGADGRVMQRWVSTTPEASQGLAEALLERFQAYQGAAPLLPAPETSDDTLLTVYPLADWHIGLLTWGKEVGDDWDIDIATDVLVRTMGNLIAQSRPSKHAIILGLGDMLHVNDHTNSTPAHKHRLEADGRWPKIFTAAAKIMTAVIDMVAQKHTNVEVVNIRGNHDEDAAVCLTVALSLFYSSNPRINVYEKPGLTWYRRFGRNLLGATHGHAARGAPNLALMMAADRPQDWGETDHRSFFTGHVHHEAMKEVGPVRVESFTTPVPRDAYAQGGGWRSGRALSAVTFHETDGEIGRHRINLVSKSQQ